MKISKFENDNQDLSTISESGVIIYTRELETGYLRLAIDVDEVVTSEQLRKAIPLALKWRDRLIKAQGYTGLGGDNGILWYIDNDITSGMTYRNVATAINKIIAEWLYEHVDEPMPDFIIKSPYSNKLNLHLDGIETRIPDPIERVRKLLKTMRLKDQEIKQAIDLGLDDIRLGEFQLQANYPVSRSKLISVLKWWRK